MVFIVLFALLTIAHATLVVRSRIWWLSVLVVGGVGKSARRPTLAAASKSYRSGVRWMDREVAIRKRPREHKLLPYADHLPCTRTVLFQRRRLRYPGNCVSFLVCCALFSLTLSRSSFATWGLSIRASHLTCTYGSSAWQICSRSSSRLWEEVWRRSRFSRRRRVSVGQTRWCGPVTRFIPQLLAKPLRQVAGIVSKQHADRLP